MAYDVSLKQKWDLYSIKETAFNEGKQEGMLEGKREGMLEGKREGMLKEKRAIARELLKKGLPIDLIAETTGLSEEEIARM